MGGLNGLINNAGILRDGLLVKKDKETGQIKTLTKEQWDAVIGVNLTGATLLARDSSRRWSSTGSSPASSSTCRASRATATAGSRTTRAAKAALAANTVTWSREFAPFGIRVGAIAPGMVETPMTQGMNQKARDALVAAIPVGRIGTPKTSGSPSGSCSSATTSTAAQSTSTAGWGFSLVSHIRARCRMIMCGRGCSRLPSVTKSG